jgi:L-iditol 2-dehydrogenase
MSNRAAVLYAPGDVRIEDRPIPRPGRHEVVVDVAAVGVCGSDVHFFEHGRIGDYVVEKPLILGHEASGTITAVGAAVPASRIGERVSLEPGVPCGRCTQCRLGRYNLCPDVVFFATPPVDGAFARQVALHADFAHPVPDQMTDLTAAMVEPFSVGLWAARNGEVTSGDRVLVTGAGPVGLLAAMAARIAGAAEIVITDVNPQRLAVAERLGLRALNVGADPLDELDDDFDALLECSGVPRAVAAAIGRLAPRGRAVLVGMAPDRDYALPVGRIQDRELSLRGTFRYANTYKRAIRILAGRPFDIDSLVTGEFPLERTADALSASRTNPSAVKSVVRPQL